MIAPGMRVIDLDPREYANYTDCFRRISACRPQAVLWREEGLPRRLLVDGEESPFPLRRITEARESARAIFENLSGSVRRVVVTDLEGYDRLYAAGNPLPEPGEEKYHYLERMIRGLTASFDERMAIYPEPVLDRGPIGFEAMKTFLEGLFPGQASLVFAVFDSGRLYFSFVAWLSQGLAELVTGFDHFPRLSAEVRFSAESLDRTVEQVESGLGPVAGALFLERRDFERLYDGRRHESLPGSLVLSGRAFGYSGLPGVAENTFLKTAGLFSYLPAWIA